MEDNKIEIFIQSIHELPLEVLQDLLTKLKALDLPKESYLLREGKVCEDIWLLKRGLIRHFYVDEKGREQNTWFTAENTITTEISSLLNKAPSNESIQLLEDSLIYSINYSEILELQTKHHQFCIWYIKMVESFYFQQIERRITELQFLDATQRYKDLLSNNPSFLERISLKNIASYLNVTQETLSRIRAKK